MNALRLFANYARAFWPNGLAFADRWAAARWRHHCGYYKSEKQQLREAQERAKNLPPVSRFGYRGRP